MGKGVHPSIITNLLDRMVYKPEQHGKNQYLKTFTNREERKINNKTTKTDKNKQHRNGNQRTTSQAH
jgi:hypothetical protein